MEGKTPFFHNPIKTFLFFITLYDLSYNVFLFFYHLTEYLLLGSNIEERHTTGRCGVHEAIGCGMKADCFDTSLFL